MILAAIVNQALAHYKVFHNDFSEKDCCENRCPYKNC